MVAVAGYQGDAKSAELDLQQTVSRNPKIPPSLPPPPSH